MDREGRSVALPFHSDAQTTQHACLFICSRKRRGGVFEWRSNDRFQVWDTGGVQVDHEGRSKGGPPI